MSASSTGANCFDTWLAERPRNAAGEPICIKCSQPLGDQELGCKACAAKRERAERIAAFRQSVTAGLSAARSTLPPWEIPEPDDPLFATRVKHPGLRAAAKKWTRERGSLMCSGPSGCGKTTTAVKIGQRLLRAGEAAALTAGATLVPDFEIARKIRWVSALDLVGARRGHPLGRGDCPLWEDAVAAGTLLLDEIGQEPAQPAWLLELLDLRYRRAAPTITTSGLTRAELETRYGSGALRRLVEPGGVWIDCFGVPGGG